MRHKSVVPWLVGLVIFGPFVVATLIYYGSPDLGWLPRLPGSREMIEPRLSVSPDWLRAAPEAGSGPYRWSLIYARMAACEHQCLQELEHLRQVHGALGRDSDRLQRVYLHRGETLATPDQDGLRKGDPALLMRRFDDAQGALIARALGADRLQLGRVLLADPQGNLVASYPTEVEQKELLRDLKRLLSVSGTN